MKPINKVLDILFRRIAPEDVIRSYFTNSPQKMKTLYMSRAETMLVGYSYEEKENFFSYFFSRNSEDFKIRQDHPWQMDLLYRSSAELLELREDGLCCRYPEVPEWRDIYLLLGQDIFTAALLAQKGSSRRQGHWFSWPAILPVNDPVLRGITVDLAENHMHLMAGASTFALNWVCLMNHPDAILRHPDSFELLLQSHTSRGTAGIWPMKRRILYAAYIRTILFGRMCGDGDNAAGKFESFHQRYSFDEMACSEAVKEINAMRYLYGVSFSLPGELKKVCLDYAFTAELSDQIEEHSRLLAGERLLLYKCFRRTYDGTLSVAERWIFYIYLLLKEQFRSEMVQVNRQAGFHNFHDYDSRKAELWGNDYPEYLFEDYRQTINANVKEQHITSLEGRFSPGKTATENVENAFGIDRASMYYDAPSSAMRYALNCWAPLPYMENMAKDANHFYVLHFPKRKDTGLTSKGGWTPYCRHEAFRWDIRDRSIALASALSNYDYLCQRVRGIDACSSELECRPEVFAKAFRFLRHFSVLHYRWFAPAKAAPQLHVTYHAGEDFLDIADGLRAVDEAVRFLDMRRGDRLGHAVALGVDPRIHYKLKNRQIIMTKQEMLDTFVWICYRSLELGIELPGILRQRLLQKANALFNKIYRDHLTEQSTTLEDYYFSTMLRGDDPRCYEAGHFHYPRIWGEYDMFCLDQRDQLELHPAKLGMDEHDSALWALRKQSRIAELCFCYHYCRGVSNAGFEKDIYTVDDEYIFLMEKLQSAMRRYVNDKGIVIECNPSSNVLIGTFGTYQKHPILTFYNEGLGVDRSDTQMHVSVNTDDPGVFDTSLCFEYALLACTLRGMTNEAGQRINSDREVEAYIRDLVRMGHEQVFPSIDT